ncbi:MAG: hypothetical protein HRO68_07775 [Nitrosopumilus sp.]|nr:hypothetical protein [Nitrosopumilus sp.]
MDEEYFDHDCNPEIKNDKTMEIVYYRIDKDSQNRDRLTVLTMGGTLYDMPIISENKEQTKIPYNPENQTSTENQHEENNRRRNRTCLID